MAGLPGSSAIVFVGPPLLASGATFGSPPITFGPVAVNGPATVGGMAASLKATIGFPAPGVAPLAALRLNTPPPRAPPTWAGAAPVPGCPPAAVFATIVQLIALSAPAL